MTTISLVSWLYNEEPYIEFFIIYHIKIGFDKIFLIVDYKDNIQNYHFLKKYSQVTIIQNEYQEVNWNTNNIKKTFDLIKKIDTEWLVLLGSDQFFFHKDLNIKKYIELLDADIIQFLFPMLMFGNYLNLSFSFKNLLHFKTWRSPLLNTCCRVKYIKDIMSHYFKINDGLKIMRGNKIELFDSKKSHYQQSIMLIPEEKYYMNYPFSLHFSARNYCDIIQKLASKSNGFYYRKDIISVIEHRMQIKLKNKNMNIKDMIIQTIYNSNIYHYCLPNEIIEQHLINKQIIDKNKLENDKILIKNYVNEKISNIIPENFIWYEYLDNNADLIVAKIKNKKDAITHYLMHGYKENRILRNKLSILLPENFKNDTNLIKKNFDTEYDVIKYYLKEGYKKYENILGTYSLIYLPNDFIWNEYLDNNPDLINEGILTKKDAIRHFINYGYNENRIIL